MNKELKEFPLFIKAQEIFILVDKISFLIEKSEDEDDLENQILIEIKDSIIESTLIILAKITDAFPANMMFDIRMQSAAIIRSEALSILAAASYLKMCGFKELDYLKVIRNEIEEFRILFAEWVKTFDQCNYVIDRWGLFNPPGVNYDDFDIDDELPFNNPFDEDD